MNRRFWMTWPFLCLLAGLFVLSVTAPRAWQKAANDQLAGRQSPHASPWTKTHAEPKLPSPPLEPSLMAPIPGSSLSTDSTSAWSMGETLEVATSEEEPAQPQEAKRVMAFATASVEPAAAASPVSMITASAESLAFEEESPGSSMEHLDSDAPVSPSSESAVKALPAISDEVVIEDTAEVAEQAEVAEVAAETIWPKPQALLDRLEELAQDDDTSPWAAKVALEL